MKILNSILSFFGGLLKTVVWICFVLFIALLATFFLTVFMPENVVNAINIFKNLLKIP